NTAIPTPSPTLEPPLDGGRTPAEGLVAGAEPGFEGIAGGTPRLGDANESGGAEIGPAIGLDTGPDAGPASTPDDGGVALESGPSGAGGGTRPSRATSVFFSDGGGPTRFDPAG